ncbi:MAG: DUF167 domain-containing protein [Pyrinomonadaceae bacterium]
MESDSILHACSQEGGLPPLFLLGSGGSPKGKTLLRYSEEDGAITFQVRVVRRAARSEIAGEHDGALRVRVKAPPVDGAANEELVRLLAKELKVRASAVEKVSGFSSRIKGVRVRGADSLALQKLGVPRR